MRFTLCRVGFLIFESSSPHVLCECRLAMGQNVQQKLREGDWLIVATDGLYDNITDDEIVQMARENISPMDLADKLGDVACAHSLDKTYVSPFMMAAISAGEQWQGGKTDDITIVTARVSGRAVVQPTSLLSTLPEVADIE